MTPAVGYTEMKESGIEWVGKIPKEWKVTRMKTILQNVSEKNHPDAIVLSLYPDLGVVPKNSRDDNHNVTSEDTSNYKFVRCGDLVINKMKAWQGSLAVSEFEGIVSPAYYVCKFISNSTDKKYLHYLLRCGPYAQEFERLSTGMRVGQWDLGIDDFLRIPVICPSISEQTAIAAYLDSQCAKIDEIIAEAKASIEDYKQWKASIIYEAVTKGLDPNAEMKDSGIEWIGEIPKGWEPMRFKFVATVKANLVNPNDYPKLLQVAPDNVVKDTGTLLPCNTVAESGVISWNHLFYKGQLLYSKIRPTLNKVVVAPFDGLCSADMYPIETTQNTKFMLYAMLSEYFVQQVALCTADRVKMPKINQEELGNITVIIPPVSKQKQIVDYLDSRCNFFDMLIKEKEALVSDLESYKKSLIYEVVTGKRRVC